MVVLMHYAATAAIEAAADDGLRRTVAAGGHLTTLAFSEVGSRSHSNGTPVASMATRSSRVPSTPFGSTTRRAESPPMRIDLDDLGFDGGAHILVDRALGTLPVGGALEVHGRDPHLALHLTTWCRAEGHRCELAEGGLVARVMKGSADAARWRGAERSAPIDRAGVRGAMGPRHRDRLVGTGRARRRC